MKLLIAHAGRFLNSLSRNGIRGSFRKAVDVWARNRIEAPGDVLSEFSFISSENSPAFLVPPPKGPLRISWILSGVEKGSGGLFNIFRAIHLLETWGHSNRIYIPGKTPAAAAVATESARKYFPIRAEIELIKDGVADSDALIATSWPTAYTAHNIGNTARKFYFVQDIESHFYAQGSLNEFASETYRWGFYGVTAGSWIAEVLNREFKMECTPFGFSYDRDAYSTHGPRLLPQGTKRVLFYARPSTERRGYELGILALSLVARKMPDVEFVLVGLKPSSIKLPFRFILPGILSPDALGALYRSCDIALVLSHTNLSLLPLELMAAGCAVVSNSGPNVEWLLTKEVAQLAPSTPEALAEAILTLLQNDELRARQIEAALTFVHATDWVSEIKSIESALYRGLGVDDGVCRE